MSRLPLFPLFALLAACNGGDKDQGGTGGVAPVETGDTGVGCGTTCTPYVTPATYWSTGEIGNILAVHVLQTKQSLETYHVSAVFANALQGFKTAAGCLTGDICVQGLPDTDDTFVDTTNTFDETNRDYTWNGYILNVDTLEVPFIIDDVKGIEYYDYTLAGPPLNNDPVVTFAGEWGPYRSETDLVIPTIQLIEPALSDNLDVTDGFGTIRWVPGNPGDGDVYLRIHDGDFNRVYRLADDGEYTIDWSETGLAPSARPDMAIGRWHITETTVNLGNTLDLVGITEQPCGVQVCDAFPVSNLAGGSAGGNLGTAPAFIGVGYQSLIYGGLWEDYNVGTTPVSAELVFTVYDDTVHPLCQIAYDASDAIPVPGSGWTTTNGLPVWQGYDIATPANKGASTCGHVDAATYGTDDLRDWIAQFSWGLGIGEMSPAFATDLSDTFAANWPVLQPLVHSVYVTQHASDPTPNADEVSFGRNIDTDGCYTESANETPDEEVPSPNNLPSSVYIGNPYYTYPLR